MNRSLGLLICMAFVFCSCKTEKKGSRNEEISQKNISYPSNLKLLSNGTLLEIDSAIRFLEGKLKIISVVDGVCMKCVINDLNETDKVFQEIISVNDNSTVVYILNVTPADSAFFRKNFEHLIDVNGMIFWDNSFEFERTNGLLSPNKKNRTFILDDRNQIVLLGNPLFDMDKMEEYQRVFSGAQLD